MTLQRQKKALKRRWTSSPKSRVTIQTYMRSGAEGRINSAEAAGTKRGATTARMLLSQDNNSSSQGANRTAGKQSSAQAHQEILVDATIVVVTTQEMTDARQKVQNVTTVVKWGTTRESACSYDNTSVFMTLHEKQMSILMTRAAPDQAL